MSSRTERLSENTHKRQGHQNERSDQSEPAEKNGRAADLQKELEDLFASQNQNPNKTATSIPTTFLQVTVAV